MFSSNVFVIVLCQMLHAVTHLVQHQLMKIQMQRRLTIDTMESSIPDPDVTLDDDLSAASEQDPFPPSGDDSKITLR